MKLFFSYLRGNLKWYLMLAGVAVVLCTLMVLNEISTREIYYGLGLWLFLTLVILGVDFICYRRKYEKLRQLEHSVMYSLAGLEPSQDCIEATYQQMIASMFEKKREIENNAIGRQKDLMEYYTMWVHQIKTPIAAMRLLLQEEEPYLQENDVLLQKRAEEQRELFRIEQYVEMALQYMRLESESTDFLLKEIRIDGCIREAVHKYARQFISKKIQLDYSAVEKIVVTDEKWITFVLEQILSNAIKYTHEGKISIYWQESDGNAAAGDMGDSGSCREGLVIEDTGIGIRAEDLPRVCEKGYTGYNGHVDKRSTGIGLYLCNTILKKLNHTFILESEEGKGTRVLISFPKE